MKRIPLGIAGVVRGARVIISSAGCSARVITMGALLFAGCDPDPDGPATTDASTAVVDTFVPNDAPYACMPVAPALGPPACLALATSTLRGSTPLGNVDVALEYFGAGDCITISTATIAWRGACNEVVRLQFSYPVTSDGTGRHVMGSFDTDASFELEPPDAAPHRDVTTIHVEVTRWQEGQDVHDIDITVTVTDPAYALAPIHVQGTFCDWPYYLC